MRGSSLRICKIDANQFVDLTAMPATIDTVKLYIDEKCTVSFKPNPMLSTPILEDITLSPDAQVVPLS